MIRLTSLGIMIVGTVAGAYGALFFKKAADRFKGKIIDNLKDKNLWLGVIFYGTAFLLGLIVLRIEALSLLYPLSSMTYIWVVFLSKKHLGEKITKYKILGIIIIIAGIALVTR